MPLESLGSDSFGGFRGVISLEGLGSDSFGGFRQ